jgi:hypothetical protein
VAAPADAACGDFGPQNASCSSYAGSTGSRPTVSLTTVLLTTVLLTTVLLTTGR